MSDFWEGLDDAGGDDDRLQDARKVFVTPLKQAVEKRTLDRGRERRLALLGPFDTGTNLLVRTLEANYHVSEARCKIWMHGMNISDSKQNKGGMPVYEVLKRQDVRIEDTVVVMMVRSPLAAMVAWNKAPYNLFLCAHRDLDSFHKPCRAAHMQWYGTGEANISAVLHFSSTMDAYNHYVRMYRAIQREGRARAAVLVTYEDLVYSPGDVVNAIAGAMGWPQRASVAIVDAPAKPHGHPNGRGAALERLRRRDWLQKIPSDAARKAMCRDLDVDALEGIRDNSYNPEEPSKAYAADCEGYL